MASSSKMMMIAIGEKKTKPVDLYRPLRDYIVTNYSEQVAENLENDLQKLNHYRTQLEEDGRKCPKLLANYYKALCAVESWYPPVNGLSFTWFDAFNTTLMDSHHTIHFEKAAVLFNLGAVHSQIGASSDRSSAKERMQASDSFSAAAGVFAFLGNNACNSTTPDLSVECSVMLQRLMLAQAQECAYENTIAKDACTTGFCARISRQIGIFYEEALAALSVGPLSQYFDKAWNAHFQLKAALFYGEACYRHSIELHQKEEIADEIARLRGGVLALTESKMSFLNGAHPQLLEAINKLENSLNTNLERAVKEKDRVYLMQVPSASSLPPLSTYSLVEPLRINGILDAGKEKLFTCFVPGTSAEVVSRYTEIVDDIIRTQAEKLQLGSKLAQARLKEMDLPGLIHALEGSLTLPVTLKKDFEAVQTYGGLTGLVQQLEDLEKVNHELLINAQKQLREEVTEDEQLKNIPNMRWTRPQFNTFIKIMEDRYNSFVENLKQAGEIDAWIEKSLSEHLALLSILDCHPIESALPRLPIARPVMYDGNEDALVSGLKQSLKQLEILGAQRSGLEDMLNVMKRKDDILPKLMASTCSLEDLFRKEISKYSGICEEIDQSLNAQEELLMHIQAQNGDFVAIFNLEFCKASREKSFKLIESAVSKFQEIQENINKELQLYATLELPPEPVKSMSDMMKEMDDMFEAKYGPQAAQKIEEIVNNIPRLIVNSDDSDGSDDFGASDDFEERFDAPLDPRSANISFLGVSNPVKMHGEIGVSGQMITSDMWDSFQALVDGRTVEKKVMISGLKQRLISGVKQWLVVDAPKVNDAVQFYKAAFGAEEVSRTSLWTHKEGQEVPLVMSAELKLGSSSFVVSNRINDDSLPLISAVTGGAMYYCVEAEDVKAAIAKSVAAGAIAEGDIYEGKGACCGRHFGKVNDPYGNIWIVCSPSKKCIHRESFIIPPTKLC